MQHHYNGPHFWFKKFLFKSFFAWLESRPIAYASGTAFMPHFALSQALPD